MLAEQRIDRPPTPPHRSPPERSRTDRWRSLSCGESPLAITLTDRLLGAIATTTQPQITASTNPLLSAFGLTDRFKELVQGLFAESANVAHYPLQIAFISTLFSGQYVWELLA